MKARFLRQSFLILIFSCPLLAMNDFKETEEIESITGTREPDDTTTTEIALTALATTTESNRKSRWYRPSSVGQKREGNYHDDMPIYHDDHDHDHDAMPEPEMKEMATGKGDFGGYYDFLINEGSYKFWAVFQLGTAALLIYSGFAALYYAKVNPTTDDDYEDYFLRRRRSLDRPPHERTFLGLSPEGFQRILDAIAREFH